MTVAAELIKKLKNKTARVAVLGMGYVGLPFATVFAEAGFEVTGIDPVKEKMDLLNAGKSYIMDVPTEKVKALVESGKLKGTTDYSVLRPDRCGRHLCSHSVTPDRRS